MNRRQLGRSGIETAPFALGGNVFGWTVDEAMSFRLLDAFVAHGLDLIDTADVYSGWVPGNQGGESETILGKWIRQSGKREKVVIATKAGMEIAPGKKGLSKQYILSAAEASLRRLQTDHIDLYQSHTDDPQTPLDETMEAYAELIQQGKIRAAGASNYSAERLAKALRVGERAGHARYQTLQPLYNLCDRADYEEKLEPLCVEKGLGVITYFSLASGFLTGKYRTEEDLAQSPRGQRVRKYMNERGMRILHALDQVAEGYGATPAQVSLAWLIARPSVAAPIASATSPEQLDELVKATALDLDASAIETLDKASAMEGAIA